MRERGDMECFHEPFGEAWYQGEAPLWPRLQEDSVRTPGLTMESVWQTLRSAAFKGPVFSKELAKKLGTYEPSFGNEAATVLKAATDMTPENKKWMFDWIDQNMRTN